MPRGWKEINLGRGILKQFYGPQKEQKPSHQANTGPFKAGLREEDKATCPYRFKGRAEKFLSPCAPFISPPT